MGEGLNIIAVKSYKSALAVGLLHNLCKAMALLSLDGPLMRNRLTSLSCLHGAGSSLVGSFSYILHRKGKNLPEAPVDPIMFQ